MARMFEEETGYPDNRPRKNFVFVGFPFRSPLPLDDYRAVFTQLEQELPIRFWHFLAEYTTNELMRKLWRGILRSDLCIFDISGGNPNVSFEVGLALARFKRCSTILLTGAENPLGRADIAFAERIEYASAATLKERITGLVRAKSTALREIRDTSHLLFDSGGQYSVAQIEGHVTSIVNLVFQHGSCTKTGAQHAIGGDRVLCDAIMNRLREKGVLEVTGNTRGARWVFAQDWVPHSHEVAGTD